MNTHLSYQNLFLFLLTLSLLNTGNNLLFADRASTDSAALERFRTERATAESITNAPGSTVDALNEIASQIESHDVTYLRTTRDNTLNDPARRARKDRIYGVPENTPHSDSDTARIAILLERFGATYWSHEWNTRKRVNKFDTYPHRSFSAIRVYPNDLTFYCDPNISPHSKLMQYYATEVQSAYSNGNRYSNDRVHAFAAIESNPDSTYNLRLDYIVDSTNRAVVWHGFFGEESNNILALKIKGHADRTYWVTDPHTLVKSGTQIKMNGVKGFYDAKAYPDADAFYSDPYVHKQIWNNEAVSFGIAGSWMGNTLDKIKAGHESSTQSITVNRLGDGSDDYQYIFATYRATGYRKKYLAVKAVQNGETRWIIDDATMSYENGGDLTIPNIASPNDLKHCRIYPHSSFLFYYEPETALETDGSTPVVTLAQKIDSLRTPDTISEGATQTYSINLPRDERYTALFFDQHHGTEQEKNTIAVKIRKNGDEFWYCKNSDGQNKPSGNNFVLSNFEAILDARRYVSLEAFYADETIPTRDKLKMMEQRNDNNIGPHIHAPASGSEIWTTILSGFFSHGKTAFAIKVTRPVTRDGNEQQETSWYIDENNMKQGSNINVDPYSDNGLVDAKLYAAPEDFYLDATLTLKERLFKYHNLDTEEGGGHLVEIPVDSLAYRTLMGDNNGIRISSKTPLSGEEFLWNTFVNGEPIIIHNSLDLQTFEGIDTRPIHEIITEQRDGGTAEITLGTNTHDSIFQESPALLLKLKEGRAPATAPATGFTTPEDGREFWRYDETYCQKSGNILIPADLAVIDGHRISAEQQARFSDELTLHIMAAEDRLAEIQTQMSSGASIEQITTVLTPEKTQLESAISEQNITQLQILLPGLLSDQARITALKDRIATQLAAELSGTPEVSTDAAVAGTLPQIAALTDPLVGQAQTIITQKTAEKNALVAQQNAGLSPRDPQYQALTEQIAALESEINQFTLAITNNNMGELQRLLGITPVAPAPTAALGTVSVTAVQAPVTAPAALTTPANTPTAAAPTTGAVASPTASPTGAVSMADYQAFLQFQQFQQAQQTGQATQ